VSKNFSTSFIFSFCCVCSFAWCSIAFAASSNENASVSATCNTSSAFTASSDCTTTPSVYKVTVYEMGLCSSHPYGTAKTENNFDSSSCVATYEESSPSTVDIAITLSGGSVSLTGASTMPSEGVYGYPYIILGSSFNTAGIYTNSVDTYYSTSTCTVSTVAGNYAECTNNLTNFTSSGNATECDSGYVGASVSGGTIDGFITDSSLVRSVETNGASGGVCINSGRLVGVMNLSTPVTVTPDTFSVVFNFVLTNYGIQFSETGGDTVADEFGSAPFSGYFTVLDAD
jgi:hypothetical protein